MLVSLESIDHAYKQIKHNAQGNSVLIFVAPQCDALCACTILTDLLQSDMIQYTLKPVSGESDLRKAVTELIENSDELRTVVFLNCGGALNLPKLFEKAPEEVTMFVVDSHRPYHLANVWAEEQKVMVLDSDETDMDSIPEYLASASDVEVEDNADDDDDDDDDDASDKETTKAAKADGEASGSSSSDDDDDDDEEERSRKRQRKAEVKDRRTYKKIKKRVADYYAVTWHGQSAASIMFEMASQLNKHHNQLLWFALVGLTDQYVHEKIDSEYYAKLALHYRDEVARYNSEQMQSVTTDEGLTLNIADEERLVACDNELRFMLLRHWSLYESMYHSSYLAARIGIWKEKGRDELNQFLAKMGLPLQSAKMSYSMMSSEQKKSMTSYFLTLAKRDGSNLSDLFFTTFQMCGGFRFSASAADMVYSTTALIEMGARNVEDGYEEEASTWESRFYQAYDCLQRRSEHSEMLFSKGCANAKRVQEAIVRQAILMKEKNSVRICARFRHALIESCADIKIFSNPMAVTQLGLFLTETYKAEKRKERPLVLGVLLDTGKYLVVGITGSTDGKANKNMFGRAYRKAAARVGATLQYDGFDSWVVSVTKEHVTNFLDNLYETCEFEPANV